MNKRQRFKLLKQLNLTAPSDVLDRLWAFEVRRHYRLNPGPTPRLSFCKYALHSMLTSKGDACPTDDILEAIASKPDGHVSTFIRESRVAHIRLCTVHTFTDDGHGMSDVPLVFSTGQCGPDGEWRTIESYSIRAQAIRGHERWMHRFQSMARSYLTSTNQRSSELGMNNGEKQSVPMFGMTDPESSSDTCE